MRSQEEILNAVRNPADFIKSDIYKVGIIELYPFVAIEEIPDFLKKHMKKEALDSWNPDEEREAFVLKEGLGVEIDTLRAYIKEGLLIEAKARFPRALTLCWLDGMDISELEKKYSHILYRNEKKVMTTKLNRLLNSLEEIYNTL